MEEILSKQHLLALKTYGNTVISEECYRKYGRKAIIEFCEKEAGLKVRVIKKIDDFICEDCPSPTRKEITKTILIETLPGNLPGNKEVKK